MTPGIHQLNMPKFTEGDCVRIDIPDERDVDYEQFHGKHGTVVSVMTDDADRLTGDERDSHVYRVHLKSDETMDFRGQDLRPPIE